MKKNAFRTKDLAEAAALTLKLGCSPRLERGVGHFWFVFDQSRAVEISREFWASTLKLNAREYSLALRAVRDLVHRGPLSDEP